MIEFRQVSKHYAQGIDALREVNLTIARGELLFLAGASGAGKSTLLKLIAAIERPSSGAVLVNGQDIGRLPRSGVPFLRRKLGLILQGQNLLQDRSVLENVRLPLDVIGTAGAEARRRSQTALDMVGLTDKAGAMPLSLSGGEQQRVAIARAIVNRPQIILADEPTANLDRVSADHVLDALKAFHAAGITCLISTHDEQFLDAANRVVLLDHGRITDAWRKRPAGAAT